MGCTLDCASSTDIVESVSSPPIEQIDAGIAKHPFQGRKSTTTHTHTHTHTLVSLVYYSAVYRITAGSNTAPMTPDERKQLANYYKARYGLPSSSTDPLRRRNDGQQAYRANTATSNYGRDATRSNGQPARRAKSTSEKMSRNIDVSSVGVSTFMVTVVVYCYVWGQ